MEKEFVPYEIALELKKLGFDEPCLGVYNHQGQLILMTQEDENSIEVYKNSYVKLGKQYAVPLWQQAFDWFRIEHNLYYSILEAKNGYVIDAVWSELYNTYEEAKLACLQNLIEVVKNR
jgi:hypothetical protein